MKKTCLCMVAVFLIFTSSYVNRAQANKLQINESDAYLVSFSGSDYSSFSNVIAVVDGHGNMREYKLNSSTYVEHAVKHNSDCYFYSDLLDIHYVVRDGEIKTFNLLDGDEAGSFEGVQSAISDNGSLIQFVNVGYGENGYVMYIVIGTDKPQPIETVNRYLCSALCDGDKLYVGSVDLLLEAPDYNSIGISIIESYSMESKSVISRLELPSILRNEPTTRFVWWNGRILLYTNSLDPHGGYTGTARLVTYDPKENSIIKDYGANCAQIVDTYVFDGKLYIICEDGELYEYKSDFTFTHKEVVSDDDTIRKVHWDNELLHIAAISKEGKIRITKYDLTQGQAVGSLEIPLPKMINWRYENFDFLSVD